MSSSTASPSTSSRTWLVHRIRSGGAASSRRTASAAAASSTCSQLSRITTAADALSRSSSAASPPVTCSAAISVSRTSSAVVAVSSLANQIPPGARPIGQPATGGDRDGGLPDPARPDDLDQPVALRAGPTRQRSPSRGRRARPTSDGRFPARAWSSSARAARSPMPRAESWTRIRRSSSCSRGPGARPSSSASRVADPLVGRQRVGLASRPVQRGDQQLPQTFLIGIRRHGGLQLADQVARPSEPQARRELRLGQLHARLVEPRPVRGGPVAGALEEIAAVALQRRRAQLGGGAIIAGVEQLGGGGGVAQHGERVDLGRLDGERVPAVTAHDHVRIAERSPQLGDLRLQRVAARGDRVLGPHVLDEPVRADERPGLEREAHQQLRGLSARHRHGLAVAPDLDGAQHRDVEHVESLRRARQRRCQRGVSASRRWWPHAADAPRAAAPSTRRR